MRLRAHHLLCLFGFQGLGYSKDFVNNFRKIFGQIKTNPRLTIQVIDAADDICLCCPYQRAGACQKDGLISERQTQERDNLIIKRLGIKKGYKSYAKNIFNLVNQNIFPEDLKEICVACEWLNYGYCVAGLRQKSFFD